MPKITFTETAVQRLKPPAKPLQTDYFQRLKPGITLLLRVSYGGRKTWRCMYYVNGKARSALLGHYPALSAAEARKAADNFDAPHAVASGEAGSFGEVARK